MSAHSAERRPWIVAVVVGVTLATLTLCKTGVTAEPSQPNAEPPQARLSAGEIAKCAMQSGEDPAELARKEAVCRRVLSPRLLEYVQQRDREQAEHPTLKIGARLPSFALKGVDGRIHRPAEYRASPVLVVMFVANHCPVAQLYEGREKRLFEDYHDKGVAFVAILSDGPRATPIAEMGDTDVDNSFEGMVARATYRKFPYPYLYDGDEQAAAKQFGPKVTPHIFIFDRDRKLRFEGRIDDSLRESVAKTHETRNAIEALLSGRPVPVQHTPVFGCSTSWNTQIPAAEREEQQWEARPVRLESLTQESLKSLRANPTGKLLMINFWATWCGPCRSDYPQLLTAYRWYHSRGFEFISVSLDNPDNAQGALSFLQEMHSSIRNLQVDSEDVYGFQKAFDPDWESGVPYTVVLAPDGKVVYRRSGAVDALALRRAILANLSDRGGLFEGITDYWRSRP